MLKQIFLSPYNRIRSHTSGACSPPGISRFLGCANVLAWRRAFSVGECRPSSPEDILFSFSYVMRHPFFFTFPNLKYISVFVCGYPSPPPFRSYWRAGRRLFSDRRFLNFVFLSLKAQKPFLLSEIIFPRYIRPSSPDRDRLRQRLAFFLPRTRCRWISLSVYFA